MLLRYARLRLGSLKHEIGGVDLAVRVRIGDADRFAFILEYQYMANPFATRKINILLSPDAQEAFDLAHRQFGEGEIVLRAVTNDSGYAKCRLLAVEAFGGSQIAWRVEANARAIIVKN